MSAIKRKRTATGGAQAEPVTQVEAKAHLRVDHALDDTLIDSLIIAATDYTEEVCSLSLIKGTVDLYMDCFPAANLSIHLPLPPLVSITSIKYYDENDTEQTWSSGEYVVDTDQSYHGKVYPGREYSWPATRLFPKSVHVEYIAGYDDSAASPVVAADNVPQVLKQAILLLIGHFYENREQTTVGISVEELPFAYTALIAPYRVMKF